MLPGQPAAGHGQRAAGPDLRRDVHVRRRADRQQPVTRFRLHPGARPSIGSRSGSFPGQCRWHTTSRTIDPASIRPLAHRRRLVDVVAARRHRGRRCGGRPGSGPARRSAIPVSSSPARRWRRPSPLGGAVVLDPVGPGRPRRRRRRHPAERAGAGRLHPPDHPRRRARRRVWLETQGRRQRRTRPVDHPGHGRHRPGRARRPVRRLPR